LGALDQQAVLARVPPVERGGVRVHGLHGALDDDVHDLHRVESAARPPRHLEEGAGLALAVAGSRRTTARSESPGALIREGLGKPDLLVREYPPHTVTQHQHTGHVLLHEERQRHHRPELRALHPRRCSGGCGIRGSSEQVRR
jgi:hypothetical protein